MEIKTLVTGSWFPRTKLHLKEYFTFLRSGTTHLPLDGRKVKTLQKKLAPTGVAYVGGRFDKVVADLDGHAVEYFEDGLLLIGRKTQDAVAGIDDLRKFYDHRMVPALGLIYSVGTPVITPTFKHAALRPVIIIAGPAPEREVADLAAKCGETVHFTARRGEVAVHYADNLVFICGADEDFSRRLAGMILLSREYEHKLRHFLDTHRTVWEEIEQLRARQALALRELPAIRDRLLDYHRDFSVLRARLNQMDSYLDERRSEADDSGQAEALRGLEAYRFAKLKSATRYVDRLWEMLEDYLRSTVEITGLMYQENLQKEINFQQFIFLLGSVAAVLALGSIAGASLYMFDPDGGIMATGSIRSFALADLAKMATAALAATLVIFLGVRPLISNLRRIRTESLLGSMPKRDIDKAAD